MSWEPEISSEGGSGPQRVVGFLTGENWRKLKISVYSEILDSGVNSETWMNLKNVVLSERSQIKKRVLVYNSIYMTF